MNMLRCHLLCLLTLLSLTGSAVAQTNDSLIQKLEGKTGKERIDVLHQLILANWLNYPETAMSYGEEALAISASLDNDEMVSKSTRLIAGIYYYKGDYDVSLDYNLKALEIAIKLNDSSLINNGYNNIGLLYYNLGSYQTALEYLLRSKSIKVKIGEIYGMPTTLNNIGLVFERVGQFAIAREYFEEALEVSRKTKLPDQEVYSLNNIGTTFLRQRRFDQAETFFRDGWQISGEIGNVNWGSASLRGLGEVFESKGKLDSAVYYYRKSLNASRTIDDKKGISEAFYLLAKSALEMKAPNDALALLDNSHQLAIQLKLRQQLLTNLKLYSLIYQAMNQEPQVILYLSNYADLRDSLFQDVIIRNLGLIPLKLKEEDDRIKLTQQQLEIDRKNKSNQLFIIILIIAVPFTIFLFILIYKNHKKNKILVGKNEELIQTQSRLITAEKMASLGSLAAGIGHEINNPMNFIRNGALIIKNDLAETIPEKANEYAEYFRAIDEGVERTSRIVRSLSHFSRIGVDMDEVCNVNDIINNCITIAGVRISAKAEVRMNLSKGDIFVQGNEGKLHQAFMNILSNAEQAIDENGVIIILTRVENNRAVIEFHDNGRGIEKEYLSRISDPFFTTKVTSEGAGLGLFITYSIITEHNGVIQVSSKEKETVFTITLPLLIPRDLRSKESVDFF